MTLPIATLYAGLLGLLLIALSLGVSRLRARFRVSLGSGDQPELEAAIRAQANFVEYAPLALILLALAEVQGASAGLLHGFGAALLVGRVLHAVGIRQPGGLGLGRRVGTALTWLMILAASVTDIGYALSIFG